MKRFQLITVSLAVVCATLCFLVGCVSEAKYQELDKECTDMTVEYEVLNREYEDLLDKYGDLMENYQDLESAAAKVEEIEPPREFSSADELQEWLLRNDVSDRAVTTYAEAWYRKALEIQKDALADGYIISADYDYDVETEGFSIWCVAVVDGEVLFWNPETDEVKLESGLEV